MKPATLHFFKRNTYWIILALSLFATVRFLFLNPISPDSWTRMAIGKIIIDQKYIPNHADISFKKSGPSLEWISHSWLSDTIIYLASNIDLRIGTLLLIVPVLAGTLSLLFIILRTLKQSEFAIFITLSITSILSASFFRLHPLTLLSPLILVLFFAYINWVNNKKKYIFLWPGVFVLWANLAGGFIFIPGLFCLSIVIAEFIRTIFLKEKYDPSFLAWSGLAGIFIVSLISSLINPYFMRIWFYIFTFVGVMQTKQWLSTLPGSLLLINQNFIRQSPSTLLQFVFVIYSFIIVLSSFVLAVRRQVSFAKQFIIFIPCFLCITLGYIWIRLIPLSVIGSAPLFGFLINKLVTIKHVRGSMVRTIITAAVAVLSIYVLLFPPRSFDLEYPKEQINLIKKFNLPGNVLTTPDLTGYFFYNFPNRKVLLDAQDDLFDENETLGILYLPNVVTPQSLSNIINSNKINSVLVSKDIGGLASAFNRAPQFSLLYFDYNGFLFVDRATMPIDFIKENSLLSLDLSRNLGFNPDIATASAKELASFTKKYPGNKLALGQLATIYRYLDDPAKAEKTLIQIPKSKWDYIVYTEMGRIKATQGQCKTAEQYYQKALQDRKEQNFSRAVLDLAVLYALCFNDKPKAQHYFNRYNSFVIDPAEREKVRNLAQDLGIELQE